MIDYGFGVVLNSLRRREKERILEFRNDPTLYQWFRQYEPLTEERHDAWWEWQAKDPATKMYQIQTSFINETPIGVCGLTSIDFINGRAELSLYVDPETRAYIDYDSAALKTLLSHAFGALRLNRVWAEVFAENPMGEKLLATGFYLEGTRKEFYFRNGTYIDALLYSVNNDQFISTL